MAGCMRFFFDRNMSPKISMMIAAYEGSDGHTILHLNDRFRHDTPDEEWLTTLGEEDPAWIIISGDGRIVKNKVQMAVLAEANLTYFLMVHPWMQWNIEESAWKFVRLWPTLVSSADVNAPTVFEVRCGQSTKIEKKGLTKDWKLSRTQ
jgi:hypothetical protein